MKWVYLLLWTLTVLCYWRGLSCELVFDDVSAVKDNKDLRPSSPITNVFLNDFWGTPMSKEHSHKSYRPFTVLTFRINYLLHGASPLGYHLVNILLHGLVCCLYYKLCHVFVNRKTSFISSTLFSVHPVHTEAVTGVVGRAELLSSIFFILSLLLFNTRNRGLLPSSALFLVFVTLAVFSKEQGITVLGVSFLLELFDFLTKKKRGSLFWIRMSLLVSCGVALLYLRFRVVMGSSLPVFTTFDNPASYEESPSIRRLTWSYLLALNSWLLLCPDWLCCDWTMGSVPLISGLFDPRNASTALFFALGLGVTGRILRGILRVSQEHRSLFAALCLMGLPFLPASNLFFPVGFVIAERVLYIPSMGFCLLIGMGYSSLLSANSGGVYKKLLQIALWSTIFFHILKCNVRNGDWRNEYDIFRSGLKVLPNNAKLWNNVGHALEAREDYEGALMYFIRAAGVQKDDIGAYINVGRTYNNLMDYKLAEEYYLKAKSLLPQARRGQRYVARIAPQHLSVFLNLGNLISRDPHRLEEADRLYRQAISMRSDYIQAYINRGDILIKMNRTLEAQGVYEKALEYESSNPDLFYNLGVVYIERGLHQKALEYFDKALAVDSNHVQSLMNSAVLMQELGTPNLRPVATERLFRVLSFTPESERVYFNLAMLAMDDENHTDAERWFKKAIQLKNNFRSALFNLALLLNEKKRSIEAVPYLKSLLDYHPTHVKGLILLGDIYTNQLRSLDEAEKCYRAILAIDPHHVQGRHNLCVVLVEKGLLAEAEACLEEALSRAPKEEYIARHLLIVRKRLKMMATGDPTTTNRINA